MKNNNNFNPIEAFMIGLEIEKAGKDLYEKGLNSANTIELKNFFDELVNFEEQHIQILKKLIEENKENIEALKNYDSDETVALLSRMIHIDVFRKLKETKPLNAEHLLLLALEVEKDSILLYTELKNIAFNPETEEIFKKLLKEEKIHYIQISEIIAKIKGG